MNFLGNVIIKMNKLVFNSRSWEVNNKITCEKVGGRSMKIIEEMNELI